MELEDMIDFDLDAPGLPGVHPFDDRPLDPVDDMREVDESLNRELPGAETLPFDYRPTASNVGEHVGAWHTEDGGARAPAAAGRDGLPGSAVEAVRGAQKKQMQEWMEAQFEVEIDPDESFEQVEAKHAFYRKKCNKKKGIEFVGAAFTTAAQMLESADKYFDHPVEDLDLENLQMTIEDNIQGGECDDILEGLYDRYSHYIDNIPIEAKAAYYFSKSVLKVGWTNRAMAQLNASSAPEAFKNTIRQDPRLTQIYTEAMQRDIDASQNGAASRINEAILGPPPGRGPPPPIHTNVRQDVEIARGVGPRAEMQGPSVILNKNGTENLDDFAKKVQSKRKREG